MMRDMTVMAQEGYLGPHLPELHVVDIPSMTEAAKDKGPWYLSPQQQAMHRHDRPSKKLLEALLAKGVTLQLQQSYSKKELPDFARNNQIELHEYKEQVTPGWEEKSKGLLQVLRERGLTERASLEKYALEGQIMQSLAKLTYISHFTAYLATRKISYKRETALHCLGTQFGVTVLLTPKYHAELAGEGVEYSWAHSKA